MTRIHPARVLFAGGGTGGHIYMAVAVARDLQRIDPEFQVLFAGTAEGMESRILPPLGYRLETIRIGGLKNVGPGQVFKTLLQAPGSLRAALRIVRRSQPRIVVGLGGYSSGPIILAARLLGIRSMLIEPNVYPGFTNRLLRPLVRAVAVAFEETAGYFGPASRVTGVPVRSEFFSLRDHDFDKCPLTVLVFGGSRGSQPVNRLVLEAWPYLAGDRVALIHQTGPAQHEEIQEQYTTRGWRGEVIPYIHDMPAYFDRADLVVSRSGASTIAEITAAGRPALLIPFPFAADDHQTRNALALSDRGAAVLMPQQATTGRELAKRILSLEADRGQLKAMAHAGARLARPEATREIIQLMEDIAA